MDFVNKSKATKSFNQEIVQFKTRVFHFVSVSYHTTQNRVRNPQTE